MKRERTTKKLDTYCGCGSRKIWEDNRKCTKCRRVRE